MLFSSLIFLYLFLPLTLLGYYLTPGRYKNYWLLLTSLIFFAWGGLAYTLILLVSIVLNYFFALLIQTRIGTLAARRWLIAGVSANLAILVVFKYAGFISKNLNRLSDQLPLPHVTEVNIALPIGISFYTFHSLSYLVDIYREKTTAQKNIFNLALYIAMFSQLIAGPIVRYSDVWQQLTGRNHHFARFSSGVERFLIGLGKKVLLANTFARVADALFALPAQELGALNAWLGIICYTLQIYCDFGGYSDMAIGLGRMFGFEFKENFNFPYKAQSVKEFWRRWHISLSSFFRDYVYIPLGGNQVKPARIYINLLLVFFLTGFWHGASWSFVAWGLFHGFFMLLERLGFEKVLLRLPKFMATLYTLLVVMFAWVLFRADSLHFAIQYWRQMFHFRLQEEQFSRFMGFMNREFYLALGVAVLGSFGFFGFLSRAVEKAMEPGKRLSAAFAVVYHVGSALVYATLLILCSLYLVSSSYNPFIYYKF